MGRGSKSAFASKESRSASRRDDTSKKTTKSMRKKAVQANRLTKNHISEVALDAREERMVVDLLARINSISIPGASDEPPSTENDAESASGDSDSGIDDEEEDENGSEDEDSAAESGTMEFEVSTMLASAEEQSRVPNTNFERKDIGTRNKKLIAAASLAQSDGRMEVFVDDDDNPNLLMDIWNDLGRGSSGSESIDGENEGEDGDEDDDTNMNSKPQHRSDCTAGVGSGVKCELVAGYQAAADASLLALPESSLSSTALPNSTLESEEAGGKAGMKQQEEGAGKEEGESMTESQRRKFVRQLVRDDRREARQREESADMSARKMAAKLRSSIITSPSSTCNVSGSSGNGTRGSGNSSGNRSSSSSSSVGPAKVAATIRVSIQCLKPGKKTGPAKLFVIHRYTSLAELLNMARSKFSVNAKYDTIVLSGRGAVGAAGAEDQSVLSGDLDISTLRDDAMLLLVASSDPKYADVVLKSSAEAAAAASGSFGATLTRSSSVGASTNSDAVAAGKLAAEKRSGAKVKGPAIAAENEAESVGDVAKAATAAAGGRQEQEGGDWTPPSVAGSADGFPRHYFVQVTGSRSRISKDSSTGLGKGIDTTCAKAERVHTSKGREDGDDGEEEDEEEERDVRKMAEAKVFNDQMRADLQRRKRSAKYISEIYPLQQALPTFDKKEEILLAIAQNQVVVVSGATGSGKTTQLPGYILDEMIEAGRASECYIIVTQPRRIAAISVAERVSEERQCAIRRSTQREILSNQLLQQQQQQQEGVEGDYAGEEGAVSRGEVGYQVRLDSRCGPRTRLLYCTTGLLLRKLQHPRFLSRVSHILVDEVHERQVETDFLMVLLKRKAAEHPSLKMVLMSATMQERKFADYFSRCPVIYVEGRTFPVVDHYLEEVHALIAQGQSIVARERANNKINDNDKNDSSSLFNGGGRGGGGGAGKGKGKNQSFVKARSDWDQERLARAPPRFDAELVAELIIRIITVSRAAAASSSPSFSSPFPCPSGHNSSSNGKKDRKGEAILVFLSGIQSIDKVQRVLRQRGVLKTLPIEICLLHGSLTPDQQRRAFRTTAPGEWKIVLATNIAETSITVDDVTHVIDTGFAKEMRYDPVGNISTLQEVVTSRASARQRSGRAGRVKPGHCWRIYTREFYQGLHMDEHPLPEIQRAPLEDVILQVLLLRLGRPEVFLSECLEAPSVEQVRTSIACLLDIRAVLPLNDLPLTALGYHLAKMPVDVRLGKMLIYASLLQCVEPVLTIVAALGGRNPFQMIPPNASPEARADAQRAHDSFLRLPSPHPSEGSGDREAGSSENNNSSSSVAFSDHVAVVRAYEAWNSLQLRQGSNAAFEFCRRKHLSQSVLQDMRALRELFRDHLRSTGFLSLAHPARGPPDPTDSTVIPHSDEATGGVGGQEKEKEGAWRSVRETAVAAELSAVNSPAGMRQEERNVTEENQSLVICAICAGLFPQLARLSPSFESGGGKTGTQGKRGAESSSREDGPRWLLRQSDGKEVALHPASLLSRRLRAIVENTKASGGAQRDGSLSLSSMSARPAVGTGGGGGANKDAFIAYYKKVATGASKINLYDGTLVPHTAVLLFAAGDIHLGGARRDRLQVALGSGYTTSSSTATSGGERGGVGSGSVSASSSSAATAATYVVEMKASEIHGVLFKKLRRVIEALLREKVEDPGADITERQRILKSAVQMLVSCSSSI